MSDSYSILVIGADSKTSLFFQDLFSQLRLKSTDTQTSEEALYRLEHESFDLIFVSLEKDELGSIKALLEIVSIPIVLLGADLGTDLIQEAIGLGVQDYLPPTDYDAAHLELMIHSSIERNRLKESLKALSFTDELTNLYNRRGFFTLMEQQFSLSQRTKQGFYLFLIDLDDLKQINDTHGHFTGDRALVETARCLTLSFRHHDVVGRVGGDEFAVIALGAAPGSDGPMKAHIHHTLEMLNQETFQPCKLSLSVGSTYYRGEAGKKLNDLLIAADEDLYRSKAKKASR